MIRLAIISLFLFACNRNTSACDIAKLIREAAEAGEMVVCGSESFRVERVSP